jgi:thiamine-monophosphate kinase
MLSEQQLVELISRVAGSGDEVMIGIGDDAAVLDDGTVVSCDMLVAGVDFDAARSAPRQIGARAAAVNLSDIAAMGARPVCLLAAFGIPPGYEGAAELAAGIASHGVPLAGGDLSRAGELSVTVTAVGRAERPVLRSGGRPRDVLAVTGTLGGQAASGYTAEVVPRIAEGLELAGFATAMIDLSDGIATDAARLARASGCGGRVLLDRLPVAEGATVDMAAAGGEDYELLAAIPPGQPLPAWLTAVGELTAGDEMVMLGANGLPRAMTGWDHFQ